MNRNNNETQKYNLTRNTKNEKQDIGEQAESKNRRKEKVKK